MVKKFEPDMISPVRYGRGERCFHFYRSINGYIKQISAIGTRFKGVIYGKH